MTVPLPKTTAFSATQPVAEALPRASRTCTLDAGMNQRTYQAIESGGSLTSTFERLYVLDDIEHIGVPCAGIMVDAAPYDRQNIASA